MVAFFGGTHCRIKSLTDASFMVNVLFLSGISFICLYPSSRVKTLFLNQHFACKVSVMIFLSFLF